MDTKERFKSLAKPNHWQIVGTNVLHGFGNNWDIAIYNTEGVTLKVDVKSGKKISRSDETVQHDWHWVELHGGGQNDSGWLFDPQTDLIAFELADSFIIVERLRLIELIKEKVDTTQTVSTPQEAKYRVYSRLGKLEMITLVETKELRDIAKCIWLFTE